MTYDFCAKSVNCSMSSPKTLRLTDYFALRKAPYRTVESTISLHGKHRRTARKALKYGLTLYDVYTADRTAAART